MASAGISKECTVVSAAAAMELQWPRPGSRRTLQWSRRESRNGYCSICIDLSILFLICFSNATNGRSGVDIAIVFLSVNISLSIIVNELWKFSIFYDFRNEKLSNLACLCGIAVSKRCKHRLSSYL